jgi:hypothetical protein
VPERQEQQVENRKMVKFGGHVEAVREGDNKGTELYLVPYNEIKRLISEENASNNFPKAWHEALSSSEDDFRTARKDFWEHIFAVIEACPPADVRGAHPGNALKLYVDAVHPDRAQELLIRMTQIHRAATTNSEGLRKLVKKYDKHQSTQLSLTLLPILYTSSLYAGQHMLQDGIGLLRELSDESPSFSPMIRHDSDANHARAVEMRMEEFDWLKRLAASILDYNLLPHLVAHRGFHHIKDRDDKRPLENSLSAFEIAWTSGIHLCECDIAMTKDEILVLAHDDNFLRLALDSKSLNSSRQVSDLTFRELMAIPLKSGVRPPLLIDVLRSARAISDYSKLVIEIKPGNEAAASALARLLIRHPDLRQAVAMIMSFDVVTMHRLRAEISISGSQHGMHHRVTSFDHFGTMGSTLGSHHRLKSVDTMGSIGLSLSQMYLDQDIPEESKDGGKVVTMPKLMLLTVADPPKKPCELQVSVDDFSPIESWLRMSDGSLDGVYLQFEKKTMTPEGAASLRRLSERCLVGIWSHSGKDPDDFKTFEWLVREGNCTYVNTDLPTRFRKEVMVRSTTL